MSEVQQPETTAPDILAWREFTIRFTDPNDPVRGETSIREAFAAGWNAALASDTEAVREPDALTLRRGIRAVVDFAYSKGEFEIGDRLVDLLTEGLDREFAAVRRLRESAT